MDYHSIITYLKDQKLPDVSESHISLKFEVHFKVDGHSILMVGQLDVVAFHLR